MGRLVELVRDHHSILIGANGSGSREEGSGLACWPPSLVSVDLRIYRAFLRTRGMEYGIMTKRTRSRKHSGATRNDWKEAGKLLG